MNKEQFEIDLISGEVYPKYERVTFADVFTGFLLVAATVSFAVILYAVFG